MARLQDTEIFGNLTVTGSTTVAGSVQVAGDGDDVLKVGDDCWIRDVDVANRIGIQGKQDATLGGIIFGSDKDTNIYRSAANTLKTDDSFITAGTQTISGTGASSCAGDFHILGDHELGCVQSVADPEGLVMQIDYTDGNTDSRLFFREASGNLYGGSIIYAADVSPVFDGTTFTNCSVANTLYFLTHANSVTGTVFMSVLRGSTGPTIPGTLTAGGLSVSGGMTLNGAITGVNSITCDLGTTINEFSIDGTMVGNSDDAVPTEKAVVTYVAAAGGGPGSGAQYTIPVWATTTTLGNSMIAQNSGATLATLTGALTVSGALKAGADGFDIDASGNITDCGTIAATTVNCSSLVSTGHIYTGDGDYLYTRSTTADTYLYNPGDRIKMVVHDYLEIKPDNDDYGIVLRDSGSDSYYVNIKNVNGAAYFGDTTNTVADMIKLDGTITTLPGTLSWGGTTTLASSLQVRDVGLIGVASWHPCTYYVNSAGEAWDQSSDMLINSSTTNQYLLFLLPLPPLKGTMKLYVTGVRFGLNAATTTSFVTGVSPYGLKYTGRTYLTTDDHLIDRKSAGLYTYNMANIDCSTYEQVIVDIQVDLAAVGALRISSVSLLCYYA